MSLAAGASRGTSSQPHAVRSTHSSPMCFPVCLGVPAQCRTSDTLSQNILAHSATSNSPAILALAMIWSLQETAGAGMSGQCCQLLHDVIGEVVRHRLVGKPQLLHERRREGHRRLHKCPCRGDSRLLAALNAALSPHSRPAAVLRHCDVDCDAGTKKLGSSEKVPPPSPWRTHSHTGTWGQRGEQGI